MHATVNPDIDRSSDALQTIASKPELVTTQDTTMISQPHCSGTHLSTLQHESGERTNQHLDDVSASIQPVEKDHVYEELSLQAASTLLSISCNVDIHGGKSETNHQSGNTTEHTVVFEQQNVDRSHLDVNSANKVNQALYDVSIQENNAVNGGPNAQIAPRSQACNVNLHEKISQADYLSKENTGGNRTYEEEEEGDPTVRKPVRPATKRRIDYTRSGMTRKVKRLRKNTGENRNDEKEKEGDEKEENLPYPTVQKPIRLSNMRHIDYTRSGMPRKVKRLRKINPYTEERSARDSRFHTQFQEDFYVSVIEYHRKITAEAQWVDWDSMERANDPLFQQIISACENKNIKALMGFKKNWNKELIAQFYATVYFGYLAQDRAMFWMTEGETYRCTYSQFIRVIKLDKHDANRPKIHNQPPLPAEEMNFMYPRGEVHNAGKAAGMYTFYSILNQLLRKTISPGGGNPADISLRSRNLLARLRPEGEDFSVADYIWEEIKYISENPMKICGYAPYLMELIERATKKRFKTDAKHKSIRTFVPKQRIIPSPHRFSDNEDPMEQDQDIEGEEQQQFQQQHQAATGPTRSPDRSDRFRQAGQTSSSSQREKSTSPIKKLFNLFSGICKTQRDIQVEQRRERIERKKNTDSLKRIQEHLHIEPARSPIAPDEPEEEIESFEDRMRGFQGTDFYGQFFGSSTYAPSSPPPAPFDTSFGGLHGSSGTFGAAGSLVASPPFYPPPPPGTGIFGAAGFQVVTDSFVGRVYRRRPRPVIQLQEDSAASEAIREDQE